MSCFKVDRSKYSLYNRSGEKALRDAVHFVVFNDFPYFEAFAEACFEELPYQIEEFFRYQTSISK